ncbi:MAG: pantoate--beta-alanine ligase [Betaproteobacteria bacterium]|nr:pantoate--beta-alanine ligase [Betaproteobacteria bacterium]
MKIFESIPKLRAGLNNAGRLVLVPTMGNLHDGHISLMQHARDHGDTVLVSIFVNRLQFRPGEDFEKYPRTFVADCERLAAANVDYLFFPDEKEMYPTPQKYFVEPPAELINILEGAFRPGHFRGVATVVQKLFNIVQPQVAIFGKKDYQQMLVLSNMARDLALPIEIVAADTVRAADGLALSSRNGFLSPQERAEAPRLYRSLETIRRAIQAGNHDFARLETEAMTELRAHGWIPDYIAVREKTGLQLPPAHDSGLVILGAALLGSTRLIDNLEV